MMFEKMKGIHGNDVFEKMKGIHGNDVFEKMKGIHGNIDVQIANPKNPKKSSAKTVVKSEVSTFLTLFGVPI
jgi:hypothetical protein